IDTSISAPFMVRGTVLVEKALLQGNSHALAALMSYWIETTPQRNFLRRRCHIYVPTDSGWFALPGMDSSTALDNREVVSWNEHPETGDFFIQLGFRDYTPIYPQQVMVVSNDAQRSWQIRNPVTSGGTPQIIPISENRFFLLDKQKLRLEIEDSVLRYQQLPPDVDYTAIRLLGPYFLRWTEKGVLQRFSFTVDGTVQLVDTATIQQGTSKFNGTYIVQNPQDSGLAIILTSAKNGVWMLTMDKHLREVIPITRIGGDNTLTASPRAVFKGDSLFVVWIDHRNGVADVYGTVVVPQTALSVSEGVVAGGRGLRILPNPVVRQARVELAGSASTDRVLVVQDVAGRQLRRFVVRAGVSEEVIDLQGIAAGTYLISVVGEGRGELLMVGE
ncbi:MAG: hypothetical protein IT211_12320, partial [Armatimonadetes bacterium]|nr:hypothetical protein [Armatimonadota bacterium]